MSSPTRVNSNQHKSDTSHRNSARVRQESTQAKPNN